MELMDTYNPIVEQLRATNGKLRQRVAELEKERDELLEANRIACEDLVARHDRIVELKQQRDELLAALGSGGRHCNDDTPHSNLCEAIIDSKEADLGQGLDPFWKWAFRRGFHEAETSYKVDIATLEQQRDELLAELEELSLYVAYNGDDWVQKKARAAIASVKEKQNAAD